MYLYYNNIFDKTEIFMFDFIFEYNIYFLIFIIKCMTDYVRDKKCD